ncbi:MAG: 3-isopropylmalate dehydratase small subunit [Spirochaetaceae bacterium]|jgi:3-isopropylmalate/(R)-2-methylmalate dehydratase small subunit|nr:3-isopropylmalate dehydratase small subunit [Spirochaetaceae bacterium]
MKTFGGKVLFLNRKDINTDEIIPAKHLNESSKEALAPYLLEDLEIKGFDPKKDIKGMGAIVTLSNFGCGSSREHAPWALEVNGINIVIAENFARIFRQNMYNCGMMAVELDEGVIQGLFKDFSHTGAELAVDIKRSLLTFSGGGKEKIIPFKLEGLERALVESGGWVEYAEKHY